MKKCFTLLWPLITPEDHGLNKIYSALSELLWYCGSWEENIEMTPTLFLHFSEYSPLKRTSTFIWINLNSHHTRNLCSKFDWNWEDVSFFKKFFPICNVKLCPPPWPSGTIICTSLNLHYFRKLSCKYELFWLSASQGKTFFNNLAKFCIFVIISPLKRTWPFIWTI
jgi:hypothetical protein